MAIPQWVRSPKFWIPLLSVVVLVLAGGGWWLLTHHHKSPKPVSNPTVDARGGKPETCSGSPVVSDFVANPKSAKAGDTITLSWDDIINADRAELDNGIGKIDLSAGNLQTKVGANGTYTLTAWCGDEKTTSQAVVNPSTGQVIVTGAGAAGTPTAYSGPCPSTFNFNGNVSANQATDVQYRWERSDGSSSAVYKLSFAAAGTQGVKSDSHNFNATGWEKLHVSSPNDVVSLQANFTVNCFSAVSAKVTSAVPESPAGCPNVKFTGTIDVAMSTPSPQQLHYHWVDSTGYTGSDQLLNVGNAGPQTVTFSRAYHQGGQQNWIQLLVTAPNNVQSAQYAFATPPGCS